MTTTFRRFYEPMRPYRARLLAGTAAVVAVDACDLLLPFLTQSVVDVLSSHDPGSVAPIARWCSSPDLHRTLLALVGFYLGLNLLMALGRYAWRMGFKGTSLRVARDLRRRFIARLQRLPAATFDRTPTGELMARATNDVEQVSAFYGIGLLLLVDTPIYVVGIPLILFWINPRLTLIILPLLVVLPVLVRIIGRSVRRRSAAIQEAFGELSARAQNNLAGIRVVKAFNREEDESRAFAKLAGNYRDEQLGLARLESPFYPGMQAVVGTAIFLVLLLGGRESLAGGMSAGQLVAYWQWLMLLSWPAKAIAWTWSLCQRAAASMSRLEEILQEPIEGDVDAGEPGTRTSGSPAGNCDAGPGQPQIEIRNLRFAYPGSDREVLSGLSFSLERGRLVAVLGRVGSGKSTLAALLARLYDPPRGSVFLDGVDALDLPRHRLRGLMAMVPQESFLFGMSIRENVALGHPGAAGEERLRAALEAAGIAAEVDELPEGADSILGERGVNLSGGQRQRLAIARALASEAPLLVLDDCFSSVDAHTERRIIAGIRESLRARATLFITHRLAAAREADRILVLDEGRVVEEGRHEELLAAGGRYAELWRWQTLSEEVESIADQESASVGRGETRG